MKSTMHDVAWLAATSRCAIGGLLADRGDAESLGAEGWPRHRDYSPGDDFRWIDWSVCARHDELISRYRPAGEDRGVTILVDCSRSMSVGEPKKFDAARRGAAALGAMALGRFRSVTVATFAEGIVERTPALRGKSRLAGLVRFLESQAADGDKGDKSNIPERQASNVRPMPGFAQMEPFSFFDFFSDSRRRPPPGIVVVFSDFLDFPRCWRNLARLQHLGYHPRAVHLTDRSEEEPELLGDVELIDAESQTRWTTTLCKSDVKRYRQLFGEHCRTLRCECLSRSIPYLRVRTDTPWRRVEFALTGLRVTRGIDRE